MRLGLEEGRGPRGAVRAYLGLGSNVGCREEQLARAMGLLAASPGIELLRSSALYETEPVGIEEQRWFINAVVEVRTTLSPLELLRTCKGIERRLGRRERGRWGPREIDIDLLLYNGLVLEDHEHGLILPHPELHRRRFVLVPLVELAPELVHPLMKRPLSQLLAELRDGKKVLKFGFGFGFGQERDGHGKEEERRQG